MDKKILNKIRKCLALGNSSNPHEAAQAIKQAKLLMEKYRIDESCVEFSETGIIKFSKNKVLLIYEQQILHVICTVFNVRAVGLTGDGIVIKFNGYESDIVLAEYAIDLIGRMIETSRDDFLKSTYSLIAYTDQQRNVIANSANSYCEGWIMAVYGKIRDLRRFEDEELKKHDEKMDKHMKNAYGESIKESADNPKPLEKHPENNKTGQEMFAFQLGMIDWQQANINIALDNSNQAQEYNLLGL